MVGFLYAMLVVSLRDVGAESKVEPCARQAPFGDPLSATALVSPARSSEEPPEFFLLNFFLFACGAPLR
jgi:hypothetical protein